MCHSLKRVNSDDVCEILMKSPQFRSWRFQCGEGFELKFKQINLHKICILNKRGKKKILKKHSQASHVNSYTPRDIRKSKNYLWNVGMLNNKVLPPL